VVDVATLQTLAKRTDLAELSAAYGLVIVDECHHLPAVAFDQAVRQIPVRRWLGLTATPYRRDGLDQLIVQQCGPIRPASRTTSGTPSTAGSNCAASCW
jgi:superfamily II DNA or RNA helicase